jgi:alpha-L-fucosidase
MIMTRAEAQAFVRDLGPGILASSNWWNWGKKGTLFTDIAVKETRHFPENNTAPGETCWKLEGGWFWKEGTRVASTQGILKHMATAQSRNSNFLLNVGPDRKGRILPASVKVLEEIGDRLEDQP